MPLPSALRRRLRLRSARRRARAAEQELRGLLFMNRDRMPADAIGAAEGTLAGLRRARRALRCPAALAHLAGRAEARASETAAAWAPPRLVPGPVRGLVETFVVAFGVAFAFRAYFFQPFKIPTGSMQPTLYGIHAEAHMEEDFEPDLFDLCAPLRFVKWLVTGREYVDVVADAPGLVRYEDAADAPGMMRVRIGPRDWVLPAHTTGFLDAGEGFPLLSRPTIGSYRTVTAENGAKALVPERPTRVAAGDRLWRGYVVSGDQVFVNRFLWYLRPPRRDEIVVFSTSAPSLRLSGAEAAADAAGRPSSARLEIPFYGLSLHLVERPVEGLPPAQFYIKRCVGLPGETISIRRPNLLADGAAPADSPGIDRVASASTPLGGEAGYAGYLPVSAISAGASLFQRQDDRRRTARAPLGEDGDELVIGDAYLPMGDNTRSSYDGRYWGPVPRTQMLGPAACVYWPVSERWGRVK